MNQAQSKFEFPKHIERYIATLAKTYERDGKRQLQSILINAQIYIHEEWSYDNWDGGQYGHALRLLLPSEIYLTIREHKEEIENNLRDDLNQQAASLPHEHLDAVFIEMAQPNNSNWRQESGMLLTNKIQISDESAARIWTGKGFRVFLSHRSNDKVETARLKEQLQVFGASCFVAHEDISPTKAWQDEIEKALASMDVLVALMTLDFHESDWTDQEIGFALCRGVPIIPVNLGRIPYGFIGKFQALPCTWENAAVNIAKVLIKQERMFNSYLQALRECPSWDDGNILGRVLPGIENLSSQQIDAFVSVYNSTTELRGSFAFNGLKPNMYGLGLVHHLNRMGTRKFRGLRDEPIEEID